MIAKVIDGKALVNRISRRIKREADLLRRRYHIEVGLGILLITGDQVSMADSGKIAEVAEQSGVIIHTERVAQRNVARKFYPTLEEYATSPFIQGIFIQMPIPVDVVPLNEVMRRLPPEKDVAGLHFINRGVTTYPPHEISLRILPPEILAIAETLKEAGFELKNGKVVIVGSNATTAMVKMLTGHLYEQGCNVRLIRYSSLYPSSTGTQTRRLRSVDEEKAPEEVIINPEGEAVITWANHPGWLTKSRLKPGSIVVDMGYRFARGKISGDCDFLSVSQVASHITPVPGGVRNITHAMVLENLIMLINHQMDEREDVAVKGIKRKFGV
jgi:methylenetetrahydrofolate dehydrogenase (NADP+)/methenyltetrahydrofolate cyclohydrolase